MWCSVFDESQCGLRPNTYIVAECCRVLQGVAECCSVVQCGAAWCSVFDEFQCGLSPYIYRVAESCRVLQGVAECCSVVQCGAVCSANPNMDCTLINRDRLYLFTYTYIFPKEPTVYVDRHVPLWLLALSEIYTSLLRGKKPINVERGL